MVDAQNACKHRAAHAHCHGHHAVVGAAHIYGSHCVNTADEQNTLCQHMLDGVTLFSAAAVPTVQLMQELVVRVQLPGVESAAAVQLDVVNQRLHVHVPGKHLLNLGPKQLRYSLLPDKVSAKFDKNKQMLSVTVAVAPPPPPQRQPQPQQQQQEALSVADEHGVEQPELQQQEQQEGSQQEHTQQQDAEHTVEQPADDVQHEESKLADATAVLTRQAGSTLAASKTSAQAQWHHLHQTLDKQQQQQDFASKTVVNHTQQQPQPLVVKPRLLSRRLSALADLD
jgi:hypothetical protein